MASDVVSRTRLGNAERPGRHTVDWGRLADRRLVAPSSMFCARGGGQGRSGIS